MIRCADPTHSGPVCDTTRSPAPAPHPARALQLDFAGAVLRYVYYDDPHGHTGLPWRFHCPPARNFRDSHALHAKKPRDGPMSHRSGRCVRRLANAPAAKRPDPARWRPGPALAGVKIDCQWHHCCNEILIPRRSRLGSLSHQRLRTLQQSFHHPHYLLH